MARSTSLLLPFVPEVSTKSARLFGRIGDGVTTDAVALVVAPDAGAIAEAMGESVALAFLVFRGVKNRLETPVPSASPPIRGSRFSVEIPADCPEAILAVSPGEESSLRRRRRGFLDREDIVERSKNLYI